LDDALRRLGPSSTTQERLDVLRQVAEFWHGPISPDDGFSEEELRGKPIPFPLRWWFRLAGRRTSISSSLNSLLGPDELATDSDGRLVFYVEAQAVYVWATMPDGDDPPVFGRFNEPEIPWTQEGMTLSEFLLGACLFEGIINAPFAAWASWVEQSTLDMLAAELSPLPLIPWRWPAFPGRFFARNGAAMFVCSNDDRRGNTAFTIRAGAKSEEPLAFLKEIVDDGWEYVALG